MVLSVQRWVTSSNAWFLATGLVLWAAGMYVYMEIAPAIFIVPVVWWLYRPRFRIAPLLSAGVLAVVIWYPYLAFQQSRGFVDLRSQVSRQPIRPVESQQSWCNPGLTPAWGSWDLTQDSLQNRSWVKSITDRAGLILRKLLLANFESNASPRPVAFGLFILTLSGLGVWSIGSWKGLIASTVENPAGWTRGLRWTGAATVGFGLLLNGFILSRFVSVDGRLAESTLSTLRLAQVILVTGGLAIIWRPSAIISALRAAGRYLDQGNKTFLALSLIVPWTVMLLITDSERLERSWWMWPLQAIAIASVVAWLPIRLQVPRPAVWFASVLLVLVLAGNNLLLSHLQSWRKDGWSGTPSAAMMTLNHVAALVQADGKQAARIGYEMAVPAWTPIFNNVDPRYKTGANFDLLFIHKHGITNLNTCAEGAAPGDEFRIVETGNRQYPPNYGRLHVPRDGRFELTGEFGDYQVFRRLTPAT
jgi:hypothetical protein